MSAFLDDEQLGKAYDARLIRRLWTFVRPYSEIGSSGESSVQ